VDRFEVAQFLRAYNSSLANIYETKVVCVVGLLTPKNDKIYRGEVYCLLSDGAKKITIRVPERYMDLAGRQVEVMGQPYRKAKEERGEIEIILKVQKVAPLVETQEDLVKPLLHIGKTRRAAWSAIERSIANRLSTGDRLRIILIYGATSIVDRDVLTAAGRWIEAYEVQEHRVPITNPNAVASALSVVTDYDLLAIVRGGGEGISALSDPSLLEAVARVSLPIVTAIGHEVDRPLIQDLVHHAFPTPTALGTWLSSMAMGAVQAREAAQRDNMRELELMQRRLKDLTEALSAAKFAESAARESAAKAREDAAVLRADLRRTRDASERHAGNVTNLSQKEVETLRTEVEKLKELREGSEKLLATTQVRTRRLKRNNRVLLLLVVFLIGLFVIDHLFPGFFSKSIDLLGM
jgi:exodeoxyribonuclease VII large subunit